MGHSILHLFCACGRNASVRSLPEWDRLVRDQLLRKFKCSACGKRPVDMRRGWETPDNVR
jgi:hypothetical protein